MYTAKDYNSYNCLIIYSSVMSLLLWKNAINVNVIFVTIFINAL